MCLPPLVLEPMSHISVVLTAQYLNVCQRKLGTISIIIQTVHILQHDSADTGPLPVEDFVHHNPCYFQIIQPGRSTFTPLYQCNIFACIYLSVEYLLLGYTSKSYVTAKCGRAFIFFVRTRISLHQNSFCKIPRNSYWYI
jgi:hypothetical protein